MMEGAGTPLLWVERLSAAYGRVRAISEVTLAVEEHDVAAVIGPNGAGKTTLLNAVAGVVPSAGMIRFRGRSIRGLPPEDIVRAGLSLVPERRQLFAAMSVHDNLLLGAYHRFGRESSAAIERDAEEIYALFPVLRSRRTHRAGALSGGMQQMLAIGRGLMARPRLLLMDEPLLGLAPLVIREILRVIGELRSRGQSLLLVEQNARAALSVARHVYVLDAGRIALEGPSSALAHDPRVRGAYLGGHVEAPAQG